MKNSIQQKSCFLSIVGRPNVGKSSLLNALVGQKIAIVTDKPQTTRTKVTGISTQQDTQYVFIDTPGFHKPRTKLGEHMVQCVRESVTGVDGILFVTEATRPLMKAEEELIDGFSPNLPVIAVLNKIDLIADKKELYPKIAALGERYAFAAIVPLSASEHDGIEILLQEAAKFAQPGGFYFPEDDVSTDPERTIAAEIIREKLLLNLSDEVPHGTAVEIERMAEREDGSLIDIDCVIYSEKDSHKGIIIGKKGAMLKKILTQSRLDLEEFLGIAVNLKCFVKVRENWRDRESIIKTLGLG